MGTQNTHTESKQVRLIKEMIKICVFTLFFCSIAGKHFLIKTKDGGQDYDSWPGPLDPKLEASKAARHVSDEPLKCGQMPPPPPLKPGEPCNDLAVKIWGFVDGKCQKVKITRPPHGSVNRGHTCVQLALIVSHHVAN